MFKSDLVTMLLNFGISKLECGNDNTDVNCSGGCDYIYHAKCIRSDMEGKKTRSYQDCNCKECHTPSLLAKWENSTSEPTILA